MDTTLHYPLIFVDSNRRFSTYTDAHGTTVWLAHGAVTSTGTRRRMFPSTHLDLVDMWGEFEGDRDEFEDYVNRRLTDTYTYVHWCEDCDNPTFETFCIDRGYRDVCRDCLDSNYSSCDECEEYVNDSEVSYLEGVDLSACDSCRDNYYSYCDECGEYNRSDDTHSHSCECVSPKMRFAVPNGDGDLSSDDIVKVTLTSGTVTDNGLRAVRNHLFALGRAADAANDSAAARNWDEAALAVWAVGPEWKTHLGTFPKRLKRRVYNERRFAIDAATLATIGQLAREHTIIAPAMEIAVTRDFNLSADEFANDSSCWWREDEFPEYATARCQMKSNGGFAIRAFGHFEQAIGRALILPITMSNRGPRPTFNTIDPDALIVFNTYGTLSESTAAQVVAQMYGWNYTRIHFGMTGAYINGASAHLIFPGGQPPTEDVSLDLNEHNIYRKDTHDVA